MITGFVMYRSGYFDSEKSTHFLHTSPNGGELNLAQIDQDSIKSPEIHQNNAAPIMPSSKSSVPIIDMESIKQDMKKEILPSSKSMLHPIEIKPTEEWKIGDAHLYSSKSMTFPIEVGPTANQVADKEREAFRKQPELESKDSDSSVKTPEKPSTKGEEVTTKKEESKDESAPINWRGIWIGVLGILFVAIGSIVYFKRRSK